MQEWAICLQQNVSPSPEVSLISTSSALLLCVLLRLRAIQLETVTARTTTGAHRSSICPFRLELHVTHYGIA